MLSPAFHIVQDAGKISAPEVTRRRSHARAALPGVILI